MSKTLNKEASATKPKYQVVEYNLHYQTNAGDEIVLNLDIPMDVLLTALESSESDAEQFIGVLKGLGDEATLAKFRKLGALSEGMPLVKRFFDEFEKLQGASVGEA